MYAQHNGKESVDCCILGVQLQPIFGYYGSKMYDGDHARAAQIASLYMESPHPTKCRERTFQWWILYKGSRPLHKRTALIRQCFYEQPVHIFYILPSMWQTLGQSSRGHSFRAVCVKFRLSNPHRFLVTPTLQKFEGHSHRVREIRVA